MSKINDIMDEITSSFNQLKVIMDKYPDAVKVRYDKETGHFLVIDLDLIINPLKEEHQYP